MITHPAGFISVRQRGNDSLTDTFYHNHFYEYSTEMEVRRARFNDSQGGTG
jgi:hypothetical protein